MRAQGPRHHLDAEAMALLMACCIAWGVNQVAIKMVALVSAGICLVNRPPQ